MTMKRGLVAKGFVALATAAVLMSSAVYAKTLRYANQGDLKSLDPYTLNETTTNAHLANVYEGLVKRDRSLNVVPALAERWETPEPTRWRFYLRKGVKFQNGEDFTADDVIFSADRLRAPGSNHTTRVPKDAKFVKIDDHTVDVILGVPNPILLNQWEYWMIVSKKWAEANGSAAPTPANATTPSFISLNANGTGPFKIESHQPGVKTVFKSNAGWWSKPEHNLDEIIFTPIASDATRVAALLSGEVDLIEPVPIQDIQRVNSASNVQVLAGPELRTIYLGMDQTRDELLESSVKGKNPFKDKRVRQAFYQAIDVDGIKRSVMRGASTPTALMIPPEVNGYAPDLAKRLPFDIEASKKLLAEAGYPNGFEVSLNCPNDRYVNDGPICQAVAANLAKVGVKIKLEVETKGTYFPKILRRDTSFYMLGWTASTVDSHNVMFPILSTPGEGGRGQFNLGAYSNARVDELTDKVASETDMKKRNEMIREAMKIHQDEVGHIPLHQQALNWGAKKNITLVQWPDNGMAWKYVTVK